MSTLRRRLFVAVMAGIFAAVGLTVAIGAYLTHRTASENVTSEIARRANVLATQEQQQPSYIEEDFPSDTVRVIVKRRARMRAVLPPGRSLDRPSEGRLTFEGEGYLYAYRPIGPRGLVVLRKADLGSGVWGDLLRDLGLAGLVGVVLAGATSFRLARSIARPIGRVAEASRALAEGRTPEPVPPVGSAELAALAHAFNEMAEQLAAARARERYFLLWVSHELKTPLTAIQG
jgi:HAMP domain-containing protein